MLRQLAPRENIQDVTSPYYIFKYSIRSELTRKYYERRIRTFFDFIGFLKGSDIEKRCNLFAEKAKKDCDWTILQTIRFLQYEKERVENGEITANNHYAGFGAATANMFRLMRGLPSVEWGVQKQIDNVSNLQFPDEQSTYLRTKQKTMLDYTSD